MKALSSFSPKVHACCVPACKRTFEEHFSFFPTFFREELREGLTVIAEGHLGQSSSMEQMREECKKRKRSAAIRDSHEKEQ